MRIDHTGVHPLAGIEAPPPLRPPVDPATLHHRRFDDSEFWRTVPAWRDVDAAQFLDHRFQSRNSVTNVDRLQALVGELTPGGFFHDVRAGVACAPMNLRLSPYVVSRIDWTSPYTDPLRIQFVPVASTMLPDHPMLALDSLHEQDDAPTPGLVHRYPDKVLFLPLDVCPVYCRFCTRSYAIGGDTEAVDKVRFKPDLQRWQRAFAYVRSRPEVEDVVVSGGDAAMLSPAYLLRIGETLLAIDHVRRLRIATKGPAVMPMKILTDTDWTSTVIDLSALGRRQGKEVCLHTHFNCTAEITAITARAMQLLFEAGVKVRNQAVLIRGVNDDADEMQRLVKMLSWMNVQPYYVYQHDMVSHVEELRTRLGTANEIERQLRGSTAGFNLPLFIVDLPGGGGKRDAHSFEHYDDTNGISVFRAPAVHHDRVYLYFDPIDRLPSAGQARWRERAEHSDMVREAIAAAGLSHLRPALALPPHDPFAVA